MKYFQHDSDSMQDAKIQRLMLEFGIEGYGVYFGCLEMIARSISPRNLTMSLEQDAMLLAHLFRMDQLKLEKIIKRCLELGLFEMAADGKISCPKIAKRLDRYNSRIKNPTLVKLLENVTSGESRGSGAIDILCTQDVHSVDTKYEKVPLDVDVEVEREREQEGDVAVEKNTDTASHYFFKGEILKVTNVEHTANLVLFPKVDHEREYKRMDFWLLDNTTNRVLNSRKKFMMDWLEKESIKKKDKRTIEERLQSAKEKKKQWGG